MLVGFLTQVVAGWKLGLVKVPAGCARPQVSQKRNSQVLPDVIENGEKIIFGKSHK